MSSIRAVQRVSPRARRRAAALRPGPESTAPSSRHAARARVPASTALRSRPAPACCTREGTRRRAGRARPMHVRPVHTRAARCAPRPAIRHAPRRGPSVVLPVTSPLASRARRSLSEIVEQRTASPLSQPPSSAGERPRPSPLNAHARHSDCRRAAWLAAAGGRADTSLAIRPFLRRFPAPSRPPGRRCRAQSDAVAAPVAHRRRASAAGDRQSRARPRGPRRSSGPTGGACTRARRAVTRVTKTLDR